ncbi:MAG: DEAD/DEAH box helicase [Candidatus Magasanikbacteria bacterium]|jgi:ATP-dependent RNA helicase RhlE|nr:DEAD/DEAH box helicase [Candidatus Magasanikbacteria bacterium]MBT5263047.1 DEAD/DEAH box helicase [Candidatus Magasanikbacteria bacterium]MBT5819860.1 DEAD/DEAH box helicase [Candidatus Magasanikbacteria bacterium]MBT6294282.1 DEAD/DEAH box helicase [Candidatus Magasanikbacteria bacterium]
MTQKEQNTGRFCDLGIEEKLLTTLTKKGFTTPTPIQHQVIPGALQGKDVVGIAQTGTGKTLAFGIPMIQHLSSQKGQGLILVPTRELALQVEDSLKQICGPIGLRSAVFIGGTSKGPQIRALRQNPHIIIATPGRLVDLMDMGVCRLDKITLLTFDEADRMLDIGFLPQIKRILTTIPKKRQTLLFSATMPKTISSLAREFMSMPLRIEIAPQGTSAENIEQEIFMVNKNSKMRLLDSLLEEYKTNTTLIFSRTKHGAKRIASSVRNMGYTATEIHSNRSQSQRKMALDGFRKGKFRIMVATDIASRGIDVKEISLVINFDLPDSTEDYVHRIGRTGRAGRLGKAISFAEPSQKFDIKKIERLIRKTLPKSALPELPPEREKPKYDESGGNRNFAKRGSRKHAFPKHKKRSRDNKKHGAKKESLFAR